MEFVTASPELVERFYSALPDSTAVQRRKMFGHACAFVNGNMFAGLHGSQVFVRLQGPLYDECLRSTGATAFEPMPGRPMKGYAVLPETVLTDAASLRDWVGRSFESIATMPAKIPKTRAKKRA